MLFPASSMRDPVPHDAKRNDPLSWTSSPYRGSNQILEIRTNPITFLNFFIPSLSEGRVGPGNTVEKEIDLWQGLNRNVA